MRPSVVASAPLMRYQPTGPSSQRHHSSMVASVMNAFLLHGWCVVEWMTSTHWSLFFRLIIDYVMNIQNLTLDSSKVVGCRSCLQFHYIIIIYFIQETWYRYYWYSIGLSLSWKLFFWWLPSHHGSGPILSARSSKSNDLPNLNDSAAKEPHVGLPVNTRLKMVFRKLECHMNYGQDIILHDISLYCVYTS